MKKILVILVLSLIFQSGCKKNDSPPLSGIVTIDNSLYGSGPYYSYGFSFVLAEKISTLDNPPPDISVDNNGTLENLIFQANNYKDSFYKEGEYPNAAAAEQAFKNLTSLVVTKWQAMGDSVRSNQIWIYRSGTDNYSKFRIISTKSEARDIRDYAECTFEWVYQPDGSLTFPGK